MDFKERLQKLRKEMGFTQEDLGKHLNYGSSAISNYENGKTQPNISDLIKLASVFHVSLDYLCGRTELKIPFEYDYPENNVGKAMEYINLFLYLEEKEKKDVLEYIHFLNFKKEK